MITYFRSHFNGTTYKTLMVQLTKMIKRINTLLLTRHYISSKHKLLHIIKF